MKILSKNKSSKYTNVLGGRGLSNATHTQISSRYENVIVNPYNKVNSQNTAIELVNSQNTAIELVHSHNKAIELVHSHNKAIELVEITRKFLDTNDNEKLLLQIENIFKSYKSTNNGVISDKSIFTRTGGATINIKHPVINTELIAYCSNVSNNDVNDINNFLESNPDTELDSTIYLKELIRYNNNIIIKNITISYNPVYEYKNCNNKNLPLNDVQTSKKFQYKEYNKDIAEAYEKHFLDNFSKWQTFIIRQQKYIETLSIEKKRIIQDYTKPSSFDFYKLSKSTDTDDINKFNIDPKQFGDSFYKQIEELYPDKFKAIEPTYNKERNRLNAYTQSKFKDSLNSDEWRNVLNNFIKDIDDIIKEAPIVTDILYCYRGVSNHYIKKGDYSKTHYVRVFTSNRLSSYTLDFNIAKNFYHLGALGDLNCIYRTAIMPFSRILYVAPLSLISNECEFISPTDSVFIYRPDGDNKDIKPTKSYNNIEIGNGICSKDNVSFDSLDTILFSTQQPDNYIENILNKDKETIDNLKQILSSIDTVSDYEIIGDENLKELIFNIYTYSLEKSKNFNDNRDNLLKIIDDLYKETISKDSVDSVDSTDNTEFSIVTANIFNNLTNDLVNKLIEDNPTIICTQETNSKFHRLMAKHRYYLKETNKNTGFERIEIYGKQDVVIKGVRLLPTENCNTPRHDLIITALYKGRDINIGIVHLCGGRYDEMNFIKSLKDDRITSLDIKLNKIKKIKEEQLEKMINHDVDIILGDFNSDIEQYLGTINEEHNEYFRKLDFTNEMMEEWNKKPFELLEQYSNVCGDIDNCKSFYTKHTSIYKTSPDAIYYKNDKFTVSDYKIIDLLTRKLSDHNGIYAKFNITKQPLTGGKKNKKNKKI